MSDKIKIAIVLGTLGFGGGEKVALNLALELNRITQFNPFFIVGYSNEFMLDIPVKVYALNETPANGFVARGFSLIQKIKKLRQVFRFTQPDVVLSVMSNSNLISLLARERPTPVIVSEHNVLIRKQTGLIDNYVPFLLRWICYKKANAIIAVSEGVKSELLSIIDASRIKVIYNPIDLEDVVKKSREPLSHLQSKEYILGVGRLVPQKGFDTLIKAFALLNHPTLELIILGEGTEKEALISLSRQLEIEEHVHIFPFQKNPYNWMRNARLFVLSSRYEGFGLVLAEALACKVPVVSTNCNYGPSEILLNGQIGHMCVPDQPKALADAIIQSMNEPNMPSNKVNESLQRFSSSLVSQQYATTIQKVVEDNKNHK